MEQIDLNKEKDIINNNAKACAKEETSNIRILPKSKQSDYKTAKDYLESLEERQKQMMEQADSTQEKEIIKYDVKIYTKEAIRDIKNLPEPKQSDYKTTKEYLESLKEYQKDIIQIVNAKKLELLRGKIAEYDELLDDKMKIEQLSDRQDLITKIVTFNTKSRIKNGVIGALTLGVIFPQYVSPIIVFGIPVLAYYIYEEKASLKLQRNYHRTKRLINQRQDEEYENLHILRKDFHDTKTSLRGIERRAEKGEYIIDSAISYLNPEILEEKPKVYQKV